MSYYRDELRGSVRIVLVSLLSRHGIFDPEVLPSHTAHLWRPAAHRPEGRIGNRLRVHFRTRGVSPRACIESCTKAERTVPLMLSALSSQRRGLSNPLLIFSDHLLAFRNRAAFSIHSLSGSLSFVSISFVSTMSVDVAESSGRDVRTLRVGDVGRCEAPVAAIVPTYTVVPAAV